MIDKVLIGCKFHFLQSVVKVAVLVTDTESQQFVFIAIAKLVPDCNDEEKVRNDNDDQFHTPQSPKKLQVNWSLEF